METVVGEVGRHSSRERETVEERGRASAKETTRTSGSGERGVEVYGEGRQERERGVRARSARRIAHVDGCHVAATLRDTWRERRYGKGTWVGMV